MKTENGITTVILRECESCAGTGLYRGLGEREGAAVVCYRCKGTGKERIEVRWKPFTGRKAITGVSRVYEVNPGIAAAPGVVPGGVPFADWNDGKPFPERGAEMRGHTCPAWWYQTLGDPTRKGSFPECEWGMFSQCSKFPKKALCWIQFDQEKR